MRDHRKGPDRGVEHASVRRADERETERVPERPPEEVVTGLLADGRKVLEAIAETSIPKLEAAQASEGDRRRPRERRADYDLAAEGIELAFKSAAAARAHAVEHAKRHKLDVQAMLADFDRKVAATRQRFHDAPKAPPRFERVPGEAAIAQAIAMPPGAERNTELTLLFSELDQVSARALHRRLASAEPDPDDAVATAFQGVTSARQDLLGILDGTKKVRIDRRRLGVEQKTPDAPAPGPGTLGAIAEGRRQPAAPPETNRAAAPTPSELRTSLVRPPPATGSAPIASHAPGMSPAIGAGGPASGQPALQRKPDLTAGSPAMGPIGGSARDETPAWKKQAGSAKDYVGRHGQAIIDGLRSQIASVPFATGMGSAAWASGSAARFAGRFALEFFLQREVPWQFLVTTLGPHDAERLLDKGRDALAIPDLARSYNPGVQIELGNAYKAKIRESLQRVIPRYVSAWNQHVLAEEARLGKRTKDATPPAAPEPAEAEIRASAPIDPYVIRALHEQLRVDFRRYRRLHPDERQAHAIKRIDKVTLEIQWRHQAINWVRATPPDATAEDVAHELYGSETFAYLIVPAAPLFGFRTDGDGLAALQPTYRDKLSQIRTGGGYAGSAVPDHGRADEPSAQVLAGPLGDEAAKNQARGHEPTPGLTRAGLVERMRAIVGEFDWLQQSVAPWGQQALLDPAKHRVDQRSRELARASDPAAGADWDAQSQLQLEVVRTARNAVQVAARQAEAFKTFPSARGLITNLVWDYVEAAAVSDLGATARAKLAAAEQKSRMFPADLMEALLDTFRPVIHAARIKKTRLDGRAGDWDDARYGAGAMQHKELALRQRLATVRDLLMAHPENARPELDRLLAEITTLSTEVTLVSNMDSCDAAWAALDASLSKIGGAVSVVTSKHGNAPIQRDMAAVATMRMEWKAIYDPWKASKTTEDKKAAEDQLSAKAKSKEWAELFERIRKDIEDHETYDKWVTFGVMVGIAIITGGIGAYVEAAAGAAWGAVAGFAASTVVEAAAFATLSQTLIQKDATLATFFSDFESNLLMFGGLKAVGKIWGAGGKALGLADETVGAGGVLVQFAALNGAALYQADRDKRKHTGGQGLTGDEIASISFHNLGFLVAVSIGQWIAKPFLVNFQLDGRIRGDLIAARSAGARVETLVQQVVAAKGKDPAKAHQLNSALADALAKRKAVIERLGEQVALYEAGRKSALSKAQYEQIKAETAEHARHVADFERMQILDLLEPAGPDRFEVGGAAAMKRVVEHYGGEAVLIGTDPVTSARTYEIRTKDSAPWRVTERVHAKPGETSRPPATSPANTDTSGVPPDRTPAHRVADALAAHREPSLADIVELRRELASGSVNADILPEAVRRKVFQGWNDVPASLQATAEQTNFARVRHGTPGVIRSESELSNADVAESMNTQLQKIKSGQVDQMVNRFPEAQRDHVRRVLARASGFGQMESMNALHDAVQRHLRGELYTPGSGSLADNLTYLSSKSAFKTHPATLPTTKQIKPGTVVILDDVVLARIRSDRAFAHSLTQPGVVLLRPRGFVDGINMFEATPQMIEQRIGTLLERALRIENSGRGTSFDEAITQALDATTDRTLKDAEVHGHVETVDPAAHPDLSSEGIANQLNGEAGITAEQIAAVLSGLPEADRAMVREVMAQQSEVFSPRRLGEELATQHAKILASAGIPRDKIFFLIPQDNKSYGMLAMAHREATGTPIERYINGPGEIAVRNLGPDTMVVIFDDVAGSGQSLVGAASEVTFSRYKGKIVVSPIVSTLAAKAQFEGPDGLATRDRKITYDPGRVVSAINDSPMFRGLTGPQQTRLINVLGKLGWGRNGLSMAFPYMSPDNNNQLFADQIAKEFIMNKNKDAAKNPGGPWAPVPLP